MPEPLPPEPHSTLLTPLQRKIAAAALTGASIVLILAVIVLFFMVMRTILSTFSSVIWPLAVSAILATLLRPIVAVLEQRMSLSRVQAAVVLYALFVVTLGGIMVFVFIPLVEQLYHFLEFLSGLPAYVREKYPEVMSTLQERFGIDNIDWKTYTEQTVRQVQQHVLPTLRAVFSNLFALFSLLACLGIIPIYLFFLLLTDRDLLQDLEKQMTFLRPQLKADIIFLINEFRSILLAFFRGQMMIGMIMGVLLTIGFAFIGVNFALLLGLTIGLLNIIPYLGTILGLASVLPIAYFQPNGGLTMAALALAVFIAVQLIESYVLTPRIMGRQTGLHPMVIIISIFFWGAALGGILGMILAVPLTAFFIIAWRLAKLKYLPHNS